MKETLETIRTIEDDLAKRKLAFAKDLRAARNSLGLSLRDAGRKVRLAPASLLNIENGESWKTPTIARIVRAYERLAA
jgi:transcriptional regulator with XRE-family HTH domain